MGKNHLFITSGDYRKNHYKQPQKCLKSALRILKKSQGGGSAPLTPQIFERAALPTESDLWEKMIGKWGGGKKMVLKINIHP